MARPNDKVVAAHNLLQTIPGVPQAMFNQAKVWLETPNTADVANLLVTAADIASASGLGNKSRRVLLRAVILAHLATGQTPATTVGVQALKARLPATDEAALRQMIVDLVKFLPIRASQDVVLGWSARQTGGGLQQRIVSARTIALTQMQNAIDDLEVMLAEKSQTDTFKKYFGAQAGSSGFQAVYAHFKLMHTTLQAKQLYVYYRGTNPQRNGSSSDFPYVVPSDFMGVTHNAGADGATLTPRQRMQMPLSTERDPTAANGAIHIMLGGDIDTHDAAKVAEIIIHELSHFVCGTRDVKLTAEVAIGAAALQNRTAQERLKLASTYRTNDSKWLSRDTYNKASDRRKVRDTYGETNCQNLAELAPDKAVWNADNYALYAMACHGVSVVWL